MKTLLFSLIICLASTVNAQRIKYEIFSTSSYNIKTNYTEPVVQNFIHAYVENNTLVIDNRSYKLNNRRLESKGLSDYVKYDAVDNKNQKCTVAFETIAGESWATKNKIYIVYEGTDLIYIYLSRDPE